MPESERGSILLCDPTHHSIILQMTTISCCTSSTPPRWVTSAINVN